MIPKKVFEAERAHPRVKELYDRVSHEPTVKRIAISQRTAVNLHFTCLSVEHAHKLLDTLDEIRDNEALRRAKEGSR